MYSSIARRCAFWRFACWTERSSRWWSTTARSSPTWWWSSAPRLGSPTTTSTAWSGRRQKTRRIRLPTRSMEHWEQSEEHWRWRGNTRTMILTNLRLTQKWPLWGKIYTPRMEVRYQMTRLLMWKYRNFPIFHLSSPAVRWRWSQESKSFLLVSIRTSSCGQDRRLSETGGGWHGLSRSRSYIVIVVTSSCLS